MLKDCYCSDELCARFRSLLTILFLVADTGKSAELFRYRGAARDGGTLEYVFESDEKDVPKTSRESIAIKYRDPFQASVRG
jgi:hypothetical protein